MRWMDLLFAGVGWNDIAFTLNRIAIGAFFMLSGFHKLFNAERHRSIVDQLKALGVPAIGFNQWWVPLVEFTGGGGVKKTGPDSVQRKLPRTRAPNMHKPMHRRVAT